MRRRDRYDAMADALRQDEGSEPQGVLVLITVPPSFRGKSQSEVRRKLSHPDNVAGLLDTISATIVQYFNNPAQAADLIANLQTAAKRAVDGEGS